MSRIDQFVQSHSADILTSPVKPNIDTIREAEELLTFTFGKQLNSYLTTYGFLIYQFIELHGINERQKMSSDLIINTQKARENFGDLEGFVVIENLGGGNYILCDEQDQVHEYLPMNEKKMKPLKLTFDEYVINRFNEID
ncbi:SMI1/KNR4 family protein [Saccharococcus sp. Marseille-Q5394]|uniref:SMI1/KNR4 family protein n=1 Tax=Saccharococcus sp. Marseille-Q5394 TaxID=2972778 RepID=UPI0021C5E577|nr:SMI1/KNR4 family protein [Saccharococcus sp. Marseille-Q5394]